MARVVQHLRRQAKSAIVTAQIKKPLKQKLDSLCAERRVSLETLVTEDSTMAQIFSETWEMFPPDVQTQVDRNFFVQSCMKEKHRLIAEMAGKKVRKPPLLERLRQKNQAKKA